MSSPPHEPAAVLHPGISFTPEDDEVITRCLRFKAAGEPLPPPCAQFVHDADVYAADPAKLVANFIPASARTGESKSWYFFCYPKAKSTRGSRKSRTIGEGEGTWHSEYRKDVVDGEGLVVGYRRSFSHETNGGEKSGWLMMEFGFCDDDDNQENQEVSPVLCKVYQTPRKRRSAANSSSSSRSALKRKAEDKISDTGWSARSRRKLVFPSTPTTNPATPPTMGATETPEDLLPETPALFMTDDHSRSLLSCNSYDDDDDDDNNNNNTTLTPVADESPPVQSVLQAETTWTLDQSFFSPHHAGPSAEISDGMALLLPWADRASPSCTPYAETSLAPLPFQC
ncbi:hypothetical protein BRADI_2g20590v3 [Brachypodium distachyon]|uniref:NAC domain-containing protein n=1 Tax=Brachypodium distachyon TaxID=15368 RepID=I1HHW6_BRADI|nr:hypothetical protein BRADI_2g20590v3 [Brachypodium distachyon]